MSRCGWSFVPEVFPGSSQVGDTEQSSQERGVVLTKSSSCPESSGSYHQQDQDGRLLLILTN